jgi:hypothetical protein
VTSSPLVRGHAIPEVLWRTINEGRWQVKGARLSEVLLARNGPRFDGEPYCLSLDEMEAQLQYFFNLTRFGGDDEASGVHGNSGWTSMWGAYGFRSSSRHGPVSLPWLDLDAAIPIITSSEEGPEVWLDYRPGSDCPCVVVPIVSCVAPGPGRNFVRIADDVGSLLDEIVERS